MTLTLLLAGCQTGESAPQEAAAEGPQAAASNPRVLTETAPTASEMERAIAPTVPTDATADTQPMRIELATPTQNGSRPKAPLPPITANPSPYVDEVTTMPTRELHGYAFPGTEAIQQPQMTEIASVDAAAAPAAADNAALESARAEAAQARAEAEAAKARLAEVQAQAKETQDAAASESSATLASLEERKQRAESEAAAAEAAAASAKQRAEAAIAEAESAMQAARESAGARVQTAATEAQREAEAAEAAQAEKVKADAEREAALAKAAEARATLEAEIAKSDAAVREAQERSRAQIAEAEAAAQAAREAADKEIAAEAARAESARAAADASTKVAAAPAPESDAGLLETVAAGGVASNNAASEWEPVDESFYEAPSGPYQIGAGDILELKVFSDPTLDREVSVRYDGNVSLPLMADIDVEGLTREEAERQIREAYASIFRNPQLSLLVKQTTSKTFVVIGDIETPGVYPYLRPTTLIEGISLAGGLRKRNSSSSTGGFVGVTGQLTKAFVVRHREGERMVVQFDLRELGSQGAHSADAPLYPGDLIYVPEGVNLVYLLGESANPVIVELTEGMTLLQMLSLSGGFNASTARLRNVVLMRQVDTENTRVMSINVREILRTGRDIPLSPGDIIYIPQKWTVRLSEFVARFTGSISPVLDMYNSAVEAYYGADLARRQLNSGQVSRTLQRLTDIEQFGTSTSNIVNLFGAP
jgi:polysaccharide export outer membrane protein